MKTSLEYKLVIKGKEAKIGDVLWQENNNRPHSKVKIVSVKFIDRTGTVYFEPIDNEYSSTIYGVDINDETEFINKYYFWEKPIIYQLPDTEGNLSEVEIGQEIYNNIPFEPLHITCLWNGLIECRDDKGKIRVFSPNINNRKKVPIYTTNKPKRDFSPYFNFDEAPNGYDYGAVDENGRANWYRNKPEICLTVWKDREFYVSAGFRQNLINQATGFVDDWKDSLVERPKEK